MKISAAIYVVLAVLGLAAAVLVPVVIYRGGTQALPIWRSAASPGALSKAHAFLGTRCESCHTPDRGIRAVSCVTCHAPDMAVLAKQSTAFHATIGQCAGCHIEHQGLNQRPIKMDHAIVTEAGFRAAHATIVARDPATAAARSFTAGATPDPPGTEPQLLDCASCHSFRDRHLGFFGQQCADCHTTAVWKIAGYLHPSPRSEDCNQCHRAPPSHAMMHFTRMDQAMFTGRQDARVEQCFKCHLTDSFNDIKGVGWIKMH